MFAVKSAFSLGMTTRAVPSVISSLPIFGVVPPLPPPVLILKFAVPSGCLAA
jgi:hypothetical protein